jgi:dTDP-4-dehydrorhamnose reductase
MKYLVTGGHGKLGTELCKLVNCVTPTREEMDILDPQQVQKFITPDIDAVIHLAAITSRAEADKDKFRSYQVNVLGTRNVSWMAAKNNKKVMYISTEIVFPGQHGNYKETDNPSPKDWYAFTKYAGELEVQDATKENHLIMRTTFRPSDWGFPTAYTNVWTTGDYTDVIAQEIALCLKINPSGIVHIGTSKKTWYDLATRRNPEIQPEEFPDPTFLRRDLNIEKWEQLKKIK